MKSPYDKIYNQRWFRWLIYNSDWPVEKKEFIEGYRKEHPGVSDSDLQKEFVRHCKKIQDFSHIMQKFLSDGCTKEEVEQIEKEFVNNGEINVSPRL